VINLRARLVRLVNWPRVIKRRHKVFACAGKIRQPGWSEGAEGTKLQTIIYDIGGGVATVSNSRRFRPGTAGAASRQKWYRCWPSHYDTLDQRPGSIMGNGGHDIVPRRKTTAWSTSPVFHDVFPQDESCA